MKKLAVIFAIALIASFYASAAFAAHAGPGEANFSLNGASYRLTATNYDPGFNGGDDQAYFQQRVRIPWNWYLNDNIRMFMRTDWTEAASWGQGGWNGAANINNGNGPGSALTSVDYAWVKITQDMWDLTVGMDTTGYGHYTLFEYWGEGIALNIKMDPVKIGLCYGKGDENGSLTDEGATRDTDLFGFNVEYATDGFTFGGTFGYSSDGSIAGQTMEKFGYGVYATINAGVATIKAEVEMFDGDNDAGMDFVGTQGFIEVGVPVGDMFTFTGTLFYAKGTNSATETQITAIANDLSWDPLDFEGAMARDEGIWNNVGGETTAVFDIGKSQDKSAGSANSGALGLVGGVKVAASEAVTVYAKLGYVTPDEDIDLDSIIYCIGSVDYKWMPGVTLSAGIGYLIPDFATAGRNDDAEMDIVGRFNVSF